MNYPHAMQFFSLAQRFKSLASARNSVVPAFNTKHTSSDTSFIHLQTSLSIDASRLCDATVTPSLASSLFSERQVLPQAILPPFVPCQPLRRAQLQGRALTCWCAQARSKKLSVVMSTWNCRMLEQNKWDSSKQ